MIHIFYMILYDFISLIIPLKRTSRIIIYHNFLNFNIKYFYNQFPDITCPRKKENKDSLKVNEE